MTKNAGFTRIRSAAAARTHAQRKRDTCSTSGFYKSPSSGDIIPSTTQVNISWDTSCLNTTYINIYLYGIETADTELHEWENVDYAEGSYNTTLDASWWGYNKTVSLEFKIVESDTPVYMSTLPAGPIWNATYSGSEAATSTSDTAGEITDDSPSTSSGFPKGDIAAIVVLLLLAIASALGFWYVRRARARRQEEQRRYSVQVDKRMSMVSADWKPVTTEGAATAIRNSVFLASEGTRPSLSSLGASAPGSSTVAVESEQAGVGAREQSVELPAPGMVHLRQGARTSYTAADRMSRVSRVSFAPDPRPSSEYRRNTRAFYSGQVSPVPMPEAYSPVHEPGEMSPMQRDGPLTLTAEDIRTRIAGTQTQGRPSVDAVLPALSMMRTGAGTEDDFLISVPQPEPAVLPAAPASAQVPVQTPKLPVMGAMPMPPLPDASAMTPDAMLRAYAERTIRSPPPTDAALPPVNVPANATYNGVGMRVLFSPSSTPVALPGVVSPPKAPTPLPLVPYPVPPSPASLYPDTPNVPVRETDRSSYALTEESRYGVENVEFGTAE